MNASHAAVPAATTLKTAAAIASALSTPLIAATGAGACRGAGTAGAGAAARCAVGGVATRAPEVPAVGGVGGLGAVAGAPAATGAAAEDVVFGGGAPAGNVGNLMVGEAVGFGGKLIRTVSFFG